MAAMLLSSAPESGAGADAPREGGLLDKTLPDLPAVDPLPSEVLSQAQPPEIDFDLDLDLGDVPVEVPVAFAETVLPPTRPETAQWHGVPEVFEAPPDVAAPQPLSQTLSQRMQMTHRLLGTRVLVVSADADERMYLRARLALAYLVVVDEAATSTQAQVAMQTNRHILGIFNLDDPVVDGQALALEFHRQNPGAQRLATSLWRPGSGLALAARWQRWLLKRSLARKGFDELLDKPLEPRRLAALFTRIQQQSTKLVR
jgi:hypothetical protein